MFILNGGLVIIIKRKILELKELSLFNRSLRSQLFFAILITSIISIISLSVAFINISNGSYVADKQRKLFKQANTIAISLVTTGFFDEDSDKSYLSIIQASVDGRGIIVDKYGIVKFDSNHLITGRYFSTELLVDAFKGKSSYFFEEKENIGEVIIPITNFKNKEILGAVILSDSFDNITEAVNKLISITFIVVIIMIFIVAIISLYISKAFNRPFKKLINIIDDARYEKYRSDELVIGNLEIEEISKTFNKMIKQLQDVEENRKEFVANVSHELKTPLSSVKVLAESLVNQPNVPIEIYQEFMEDINNEVDRENKIINDLLALVSLERNAGNLKFESTNITKLVKIVIKRLKPLYSKKNIFVKTTFEGNIFADVDETKMDLVITNLIENAIKYNEDNGNIDIDVSRNNKTYKIGILNTGEGIEKESLNKVFDRFYRVDKTRSRETGGTGLGLSIANKIVQEHKGTIKVKSCVGKWTKFEIEIPLVQEIVKNNIKY